MAAKAKTGLADLHKGSASLLRERLASGAISASDLVDSCIGRISARDGEVGAWAFHDAEFARVQAKALDDHRRSGRPLGRLHGLPVGIKDVIDTARMPTENGTALDAGRVPLDDAFIVRRLKQEGAVIMGKTVTTELAFMAPSKTRNPRDLAHTPAGSSSGSAAAVADAHVPLAIGTQTAGSVIRPASFCGVTGFKPTFGAVPRTGILPQAPSLDTVGVFGQAPVDAALLAEVLFGHDTADPATGPAPFPALHATCASAVPLPPVFALVRFAGDDRMDADMAGAMGELREALGDQCFEVELPAAFSEAMAAQKTIQLAELARNYYGYHKRGADALPVQLREGIDKGSAIMARDYLSALDWKAVANAGLAEIFERCDALICPAAPGAAPRDLTTTGDPVFNGLWTLCGTPAVTVPVLSAGNGMPMGVQLVGRHHDDGRLLRTAQWLYDWIDG